MFNATAAVKRLSLLVMLVLLAAGTAFAQGNKIRMAFGDIATVETLHFLIAIEHARARGVDIDITYFKSEDIAHQAIVNNQADVGIGTPYAVIQNLDAPIRIFYQLSKLAFFPVVNVEHYQSWEDLDGEEITVHSRTSGTLALANLMAARHGIEYSKVSYVPGSEVRALAMLKGNIRATYLDVFNTSFLMKRDADRFKVLPQGNVKASDECLYARTGFLQDNEAAVTILMEELFKVWRRVNADPFYVVDERERLGLLPDLPEELEPEVLPFYQQAAQSGMFPTDGGGATAARQDFELFTVAGQLEGTPDELNVEDYWYLAPINKALDKLGRADITYTPPGA